jgi:hypothetical protein
MAWKLYAIEQMQFWGQCRVDGVEALRHREQLQFWDGVGTI